MKAKRKTRNWHRLGRIGAGLSWGSLVSLFATAACQHFSRVLHPPFWPIALFVTAMLLGTLLTIVSIWRTPQRTIRIMAKTAAALIPVMLLAIPLAYASSVSSNRISPPDPLFRFSSLFGAAVMQWRAQRQFPNRLESTRLVMLYGDVQTPEADLKAMDEHVARLERLLGHPLREKIWWVRGSLFGRGGVSFLGLSLGSEISPQDEAYLDRHELAHGVIEQLRPPSADPPALIVEGWAEAQSGWTDAELAEHALERGDEDRPKTLAGLVSPAWYYRHDATVYSVGGVFTRFVLERYGVQAFIGLYTRTNPRWFLNAFPVILGDDAETVERELWKWIHSKEKVKNGRANREL